MSGVTEKYLTNPVYEPETTTYATWDWLPDATGAMVQTVIERRTATAREVAEMDAYVAYTNRGNARSGISGALGASKARLRQLTVTARAASRLLMVVSDCAELDAITIEGLIARLSGASSSAIEALARTATYRREYAAASSAARDADRRVKEASDDAE